jgi:hypothetical protein
MKLAELGRAVRNLELFGNVIALQVLEQCGRSTWRDVDPYRVLSIGSACRKTPRSRRRAAD